MRCSFFFALIIAVTTPLAAQRPEAYQFKEVKSTAATPVKNQEQTGTCWAFSTASFLESEAMRMGKGSFNLSEMYVVRHIYRHKCENYVRRQGHAQFGEGGLAHDLLNAIQQYGIMPESDYPGRKDASKPYNHSALEASLKKFCDGLIEQGPSGRLAGNWISRVDSLLDMEFGKVPVSFVVNGTQFTPTSFRDFLGINPADYVSITSYTHHPFYKNFILEIPDNWANGTFFNLPLNEMMRCLNYAVQQGYSVEWDADVSNKGFSAQNGLAIVPEKDWKNKDNVAQAATFKYWESEKSVTQEYRQEMFDRLIVQDDHLMHITGIFDEVHSGLFYAVKNSWGEISDLKGYVNTSEAYMRLNTISFTVHKNALPTDVRKMMGLDAGDVNIEGGRNSIRPREEKIQNTNEPVPAVRGGRTIIPVSKTTKLSGKTSEN